MAKRNVKTAPEERPVQDENVVENNGEQLLGEGTTVEEPEKVSDGEQLLGEGTTVGELEKVSDGEQLLGEGTTVGEPEKVPDVVQLSEKDKSVECLAVDKKQKIYEITCKNQITKQIGGVNFENGVGHTCDDYAASWFAAKDGYTVSLVK